MCATLEHRGPDAQGIHAEPGAGLGQRRLAIIDRSQAGVAPLANEDGTIWVTFNGEVYNFRDLRTRLEERGHHFRSGTDTEVIVHLYEEYGENCVHHMHGMFAFAIWDRPRRRLLLARDRLGKKPLYYATVPGGLVFGSSIRAVLTDPAVPVEPDLTAIDAYLTFQYVPSPLTAFAGVWKLPPGHWLTCDAAGQVTVRRYWQPPAATPSTADPDALREELRWRLREAVRARLIADVPLGAFLSGGVDSATVVALMAQEQGAPVQTFSVGFEDAAYNELPYARLVAERYGTEHHEFMVRPDAADVLPRLVQHHGEPFADSSALPAYYLSKMARTGVVVALSGDGGDETFAGYDNYRAVAAWGRADAVPFPVRRAMSATAGLIVDRLPFSSATARASRAAQMWSGRVPERFRLQSTIFKPQEKRAAYTAEFRASLAAGTTDTLARLEWTQGMDPVDWMMRHDQHFYLPDCLMVKTDVASMAHGLEVRCPLLDHTLVEFAATIPTRLKQDGQGGKRILKDAVSDLVPPQVLARRKTGFALPLARWFREDLYGLFRATLLDDQARTRRLIEPAFVSHLIEEHRRGGRDWSARLWALLFLELWFREFID
jgi:asparagine synthase (glutamine-hydrolysing)